MEFKSLPHRISNLTVQAFIRESKIDDEFYYMAICDCGQHVALTLSQIRAESIGCCTRCANAKNVSFLENQIVSFVGSSEFIPSNVDVIIIRDLTSINRESSYMIEYQGKKQPARAYELKALPGDTAPVFFPV